MSKTGAPLFGGSSQPEVPFVPKRFLGGGHRQTLAASLLLKANVLTGTRLHRVRLEDGDELVLHEDAPANWSLERTVNEGAGERAQGRTALLIHGLAGSHASPYMTRIARKLVQHGVRTFRLDLRGCGAGANLARWPYHSGRSDDAAAALRFIGESCPGSPVVLIGFSLGANITLKLLGENPDRVPENLERALAVCPPVDLARCVRHMQSGWCRIYDRFFVRLLMQRVLTQLKQMPDMPLPEGWPREPGRTGGWGAKSRWRPPRTLEEFDDRFTAPLSDYRSALHYYERCSSQQFLSAIRIPTLVISAADDPIVPASLFDGINWSPRTQYLPAAGGGHMGFQARPGTDPDRFWLDWRAVAWSVSRLE